jgi:hypothetical protein
MMGVHVAPAVHLALEGALAEVAGERLVAGVLPGVRLQGQFFWIYFCVFIDYFLNSIFFSILNEQQENIQ